VENSHFFNRRRIPETVQKIEQEITNLRRFMIGDPLSKFWCILNIFFSMMKLRVSDLSGEYTMASANIMGTKMHAVTEKALSK